MESWLKVAWTLGVATLLDSASLPLNSGIVQEKLITLAIDFYIKNLPGSSVFKIIEYDSKNISLIKNCTAFFMEQKIRTTCNTVMLKNSYIRSKRDDKEKEKKEKEKGDGDGDADGKDNGTIRTNLIKNSNHIQCLQCIFDLITKQPN
ncbi:uncharacterized protein LOC115084013 isoform X3 [Rhinatrema bivittatum]|uniref:uncharacterized protein LOC115084013 isoform X3 n=1 Tax=Rhinatrema bivittatum TaxID=194408 RepID=UPI0011281A9E|nr:uncharacterized protein LOC115084013 isoform X3 [Rhinatrema bivittatum]